MAALVALPQFRQLSQRSNYDSDDQETPSMADEASMNNEDHSVGSAFESVIAANMAPADELIHAVLTPEQQLDAHMDEALEDESGSDEVPDLLDSESDLPATNDEAFGFATKFVPPAGSDSIAQTETFGGLSNLGNTCYMAAALQMLVSLDKFVDTIREEEPETDDAKLRTAFLDLMRRVRAGETVTPNDFKDAVDERSPLFLGFRQQDSHEFLTTLLDLLDEDYKKKSADDENDKTVESSAVKEEEALESVAKKPRTEEPMETEEVIVAPKTPPRPANKSMGSFSLLDNNAIERLLHGSPVRENTYILPDVSTTCFLEPQYKLIGGRMAPTEAVLTPYESSSSRKVATETTEPSSSPVIDNDTSVSHSSCCTQSPVDTCFTTSVRMRLTCDSCKYTRTHTEKFLHLSLDGTSVEDGLRRFFAPERRELKCEKCFCETATQTMEITELPTALLLHFKRFIVDVSPDYSSVTYRKNQSDILFDDELTLQHNQGMGILTEFLADDYGFTQASAEDDMQPPQKYSLRSVVNHIGSSASCGHYTADCNRLYSDEREWTRFNDSYVSRITANQAIDQSRQTAYMVLYELE